VVLHLAGQYPLGGIAWQAVHYLVGLARLGHEVYYVEASGAAPYDPRQRSLVGDYGYSVAFLQASMARVGLADRWAYREAGGRWHGMPGARVEELCRTADALVNLCGAARLDEDQLRCPVRIYVQTDPVHDQILLVQDHPDTRSILAEHTHHFTYGENLGQPDCPVPLVDFDWRPTRPPVVLDLWEPRVDPAAGCFTTVATWRNVGKDVVWQGERYYWSKHVNFERFADLPRLTRQPLELAIDEDAAPAAAAMLRARGWRVAGALEHSVDMDAYQRYVYASRGEFTVAKDLVVRSRCGWFSDRSVCYLAAARPVVTQDTGFPKFVPTGQGLFAVATPEEAAEALESIDRDYAAHARAARRVAEEAFASDEVLGRLCRDAGL
jgi:hypothetical protein